MGRGLPRLKMSKGFQYKLETDENPPCICSCHQLETRGCGVCSCKPLEVVKDDYRPGPRKMPVHVRGTIGRRGARRNQGAGR